MILVIRGTLRQTRALALLTLRYWARAGVPNRLRKDQGRRASGAVLRGAFLLLMINWGYRVGLACVRVEPELRAKAAAWMLVGLAFLSIAWGAMGRGPGMRAPQSVLMARVLDSLPLHEGSRVVIQLVERIILYALSVAAMVALSKTVRPEILLLGVLLPTAGLLLGDALLRLVRLVVSPLRMGQLAVVVLVLQFPAFMIVGGAPALAKFSRLSELLTPFLPRAAALLDDGSAGVLLFGCVAIAVFAVAAIRFAERVGYDRVDIVPIAKLVRAQSTDLDLGRIESVLAQREPGGRWLVRGALFYTAATSVALLAASRLSRSFPADYAPALARALAYVTIFSGFAAMQARATRLVLRDAGARPLLAALPIAPRDLLRGKARDLMAQALMVAAPYFLLLGLRGPLALHVEVLWRGTAAAAALMFAAVATVAVAFLTQGLGGVKVLGGSLGLETTLVAMPLLAVAASPYPWSAAVSVASIAMLAYEARRSALRCLRWIDDAEEQKRETVVWRALLVYAAFQAAQTLARRMLALAPIDENAQSAIAYALAALALLGLTTYGRRGLPPMPALPSRRSPLWVAGALLAGVLAGVVNIGYRYGAGALGADLSTLQRPGMVVAALTVVLASIVEEIFFRGWLQNAIEDDLPASRRWLAPLLSAFAFAAACPPLSFAPMLVLGLVCGTLYARSRSVAPCALAHAAYFAVSFGARDLLNAP